MSTILLVVLLALSGCEGGNTPPAQPREGQQVPVLKEFQGTQGPFPDRGIFVVQRADVWASLWDGQRVPDVDFSQQTVLVALMGQQQTAGYAIRISDVRATGQQVVAYVMETRPAPGAVTAQMITNPYHMVVVPKITQPVVIVLNDKPNTLLPISDIYQGTQSKLAEARTIVIRDRLAWNR
ncbi:MAG TPA: protease complex subunit PrcB family protein, partial [Armatimonadota bacterium]